MYRFVYDLIGFGSQPHSSEETQQKIEKSIGKLLSNRNEIIRGVREAVEKQRFTKKVEQSFDFSESYNICLNDILALPELQITEEV